MVKVIPSRHGLKGCKFCFDLSRLSLAMAPLTQASGLSCDQTDVAPPARFPRLPGLASSKAGEVYHPVDKPSGQIRSTLARADIKARL